jgi:hypothetical protein
VLAIGVVQSIRREKQLIYQLQYRFKVRPSRALLELARAAFVEGRQIENVEVTPIAWTGTIDQLKTALRAKSCFVGNAGVVKQYANPYLTMCDFDGTWRPSLSRIMRLGQMCQMLPVYIREDKTRHGWHMLIEWNRKLAAIEQVAIQAVLGSDLQRETYNLARVMSGKRSDRWNLLFEHKL